MANFVYTFAKAALLNGDIDFAADDIRVCLVMSDTTCDTEKDVDNLDAFSVIDRMDGANFSDKELASEAVTEDEANDRGEFDADDVTWTALGVGTREVQGALLFKFVTDDAGSTPIAFIDTGGFPFVASGADVTIQWNAEGIVQAT